MHVLQTFLQLSRFYKLAEIRGFSLYNKHTKNLGFNATTFFKKMKIYFCRKINILPKIADFPKAVEKNLGFLATLF